MKLKTQIAQRPFRYEKGDIALNKIVRSLLFIVLFAHLCLLTVGQTNFNKEITLGQGVSYKLTFGTSNVEKIVFYDTAYSPQFTAGGSCIADSTGNLQLSSDGFGIYQHKDSAYVIPKGDSIGDRIFMINEYGWNIFSQSSIFLPFPNNHYYFINAGVTDAMFISNWQGSTTYAPYDNLLWSKVEKVNGQYEVTSRENRLSAGEHLSRTQMMACKHANGIDWWLLKKGYLNSELYVYLFKENEVIEKEKVTLPWAYTCGFLDNMGMITFSPDGSEFSFTQNNLCNNVYRCGFDRCTGEITPIEEVPNAPVINTEPPNSYIDNSTTGLCYSPNGRFLYLTRYNGVHQYDFTDNTWYQVCGRDTNDFFQGYAATYIGYDGRIYIGNWGTQLKQMSRINNPNEKGAASNFCRKCLRVDSLAILGGLSNLPCQPNYDLGKLWCGEDTTGYYSIQNEVVVPNAFSPNGDGRNDVWHILNIGSLVYQGVTIQACKIYNRQGNNVYSGMGYDINWDGAGYGMDTYYYFIKYKLKDGTDKIMKGDITLVR